MSNGGCGGGGGTGKPWNLQVHEQREAAKKWGNMQSSIAQSEKEKELKRQAEAEKKRQQENWNKGMQSSIAQSEKDKAISQQEKKMDTLENNINNAKSASELDKYQKELNKMDTLGSDKLKNKKSKITNAINTKKTQLKNSNGNGAGGNGAGGNGAVGKKNTPAVTTPAKAATAVATVSTVVPVVEVGNTNGITYWYGKSGIAMKMASCQLSANMLVSSVRNLYTVVKDYVNVSGKWNDGNAQVFAEWWNKGTNLTISTNSDTKNIWLQGTERIGIQGILNRFAQLFHIVMCQQLYAVTTKKFPKKQQEFSDYLKTIYKLGSNSTYTNASLQNTTSNNKIWADLMSEISKQEPLYWEKEFAVPAENASTGGSNDAELANFCTNFLKQYDTVYNNSKRLLDGINEIVNDDREKQYFGFSPNVNMKKAASDLYGYIDKALTDINTLLKTILEFTKTSVDENIKDYNKTDYKVD